MREKPGEFIAICWDETSEVEYVRGHVTLEEGKAAMVVYGGPYAGDCVMGIKHRWARWQPAPPRSDFTSLFFTFDEQQRGCFAVTELQIDTKLSGVAP